MSRDSYLMFGGLCSMVQDDIIDKGRPAKEDYEFFDKFYEDMDKRLQEEE